jgi:hypothetical protein
MQKKIYNMLDILDSVPKTRKSVQLQKQISNNKHSPYTNDAANIKPLFKTPFLSQFNFIQPSQLFNNSRNLKQHFQRGACCSQP